MFFCRFLYEEFTDEIELDIQPKPDMLIRVFMGKCCHLLICYIVVIVINIAVLLINWISFLSFCLIKQITIFFACT